MKKSYKKILLKNNEIKEMTIEETIKQFEPYIKKNSFKFHQSFLKQYPGNITLTDKDDIESSMLIGIIKAYNTYDISKNILFMTYMVNIINNEVCMLIRKSKPKNDYNTISMDKTAGEDFNETLQSTIEDENSETDYLDIENNEILSKCLSVLKDKEKDIIYEYYFNNKNHVNIGKKYNYSQSYISRVIKKALNTMKGYYMNNLQDTDKKLIKLSQTETKEVTVEYLINKYNPYLMNISKKYYSSSLRYKDRSNDSFFIEFDDFYQNACIGLYKAFNKYDINKDILFYTYLTYTCEGELRRYIRDSLHLRKKEEPPFFISSNKNISIKNDEKETTLEEILPYNKDDYKEVENKLLIQKGMQALTEYEKNILIDYYMNNLTQMQIKDKYNTSQKKICVLLKKITNKMKKEINKGVNKNMDNNLDRYVEELFLYSKDCEETSMIKALRTFCEKNNIKSNEMISKIKEIPGRFEELIDIFASKKSSDSIINEETDTQNNNITAPISKNVIENNNKFNLPDGVKLQGLNVQLKRDIQAKISKENVTIEGNSVITGEIKKEELIFTKGIIEDILKIMEGL